MYSCTNGRSKHDGRVTKPTVSDCYVEPAIKLINFPYWMNVAIGVEVPSQIVTFTKEDDKDTVN